MQQLQQSMACRATGNVNGARLHFLYSCCVYYIGNTNTIIITTTTNAVTISAVSTITGYPRSYPEDCGLKEKKNPNL